MSDTITFLYLIFPVVPFIWELNMQVLWCSKNMNYICIYFGKLTFWTEVVYYLKTSRNQEQITPDIRINKNSSQ